MRNWYWTVTNIYLSERKNCVGRGAAFYPNMGKRLKRSTIPSDENPRSRKEASLLLAPQSILWLPYFRILKIKLSTNPCTSLNSVWKKYIKKIEWCKRSSSHSNIYTYIIWLWIPSKTKIWHQASIHIFCSLQSENI